jgi:hypothetical protein
MRDIKEIQGKQRKLRRKLLKSLLKQSKEKTKDNCKYWIRDMPEPCKCVYPALNNQPSRECPMATECPDFVSKWSQKDVHEKYLRIIKDDNYLSRSYPALFIINWVLNKEENSLINRIKNKIKSILSTPLN